MNITIMKALYINPSPNASMAIQVLAGAALAAICQWGRLKKWNEERLVVCIFTLGSCWMLQIAQESDDVEVASLSMRARI